MKITIYELLGMIKDGKAPKKIKVYGKVYINNNCNCYLDEKDKSLCANIEIPMFLNDEVEILEEEKKYTKEDFIKERMDLEGITREHFDKRYKVEECNCGMPYCKGFRAIEKEEKKIPEKLDIKQEKNCNNNWKWKCEGYNISTPQKIIAEKLNQVIDYLESKGE